MDATDPDEVDWRVWRRWYTWRRWIMFRDLGKALGEIGGSGSGSSDIDFLFVMPLVLIGLVATVVDLSAQLVALPVVLAMRVFGLATWPVQLDRDDKHFRTVRTKGFGAAGLLRDDMVRQIVDGTLPGRPVPEPKPALPPPPAPAAGTEAAPAT